MNRVREDEGRIERGGEFIGVELGEADEGRDSSGERAVPDNVVVWELHGCSFERKNGLSFEDCSHGVSEHVEF